MFLPNKLAKVKTFENIILVKTQKKSHIAGGSIDQNNLVLQFLLNEVLVRHLKYAAHKRY